MDPIIPRPLPRSRDLYDIFGERISVGCDDSPVTAIVRRHWIPFLQEGSGSAPPDVLIHVSPAPHPGAAESGQIAIFDRSLVFADSKRLVVGLFGAAPWEISIETYQQSAEDIYYYTFEPMLLMVLARRHLWMWHAACAASDRGAVLVLGPSGSGKSTLAALMVRAGHRFVADDDTFVRLVGDRPAARSVESRMHLGPRARELAAFDAADPGESKGRADKVYLPVPASKIADRWTPIDAVVFPQIASGRSCHIEELPAREVMMRLLAQPPRELPVRAADRQSLETRMEICAALARHARGFAVSLGDDAPGLAERLGAALS